MGYRLVLPKLQHPASVKPGEALSATMTWDNVGVAPPYGEYLLAFRLTRLGETAPRFVSVTPTSIRGWRPGERSTTLSIPAPSEATPGLYELAPAVVDP